MAEPAVKPARLPRRPTTHTPPPPETLPDTPEDAFTTRDWLAALEGRALPAKPPARPRSPFVPRTARQALNALKVGAGLTLSLARRKPTTWGLPVMAMIEPTSLCNLKCPLCPSGNGSLTRERARLDLDGFKRVVDKLPDTVRMLQLWNQGEPYLVKDINPMVRHAKGRGLYVVTSTNGHYFRTPEAAEAVVRSGIDEIIVSLDGADQAVYEQYRVGGKIETVFRGVQNLVAARERLGSRTPSIHFQFILMAQNVHQRGDMRAIGRKLGADRLSFKTLQVTEFEGGESFLPEDASLTRYDGVTAEGQRTTRKRRFASEDCVRLWTSVVVNCDGRVSPCCFDKDGEHALGNLLDEDFEAIWFGEKYQAFRQSLLDARYQLQMCKDCTEGLKEMYVETVDYHREAARLGGSQQNPEAGAAEGTA